MEIYRHFLTKHSNARYLARMSVGSDRAKYIASRESEQKILHPESQSKGYCIPRVRIKDIASRESEQKDCHAIMHGSLLLSLHIL